jgi:hypothetical protein
MARHVVSTIFSILYALCAAFVAFELWQMARTKANLRGYKAAYNYLTLVWALVRAIFWATFALDAALPRVIFFVFYWLPLAIQYLTFALLATFLLKLVVGLPAWRDRVRALARRAFVAVGALALAGELLLAALAAFVDEAFSRNAELLLSAVLSVGLAGVFCALAARLRRVAPSDLARTLAASPAIVLSVTVSIMLVFLSRFVYNVCAFADIVTIDIDRDDIETDLAAVCVYGTWEFFPLVLLLSTLAAAPKSSHRARGDVAAPTFGVFGAIQALEDDAASGSEQLARSEPMLAGDADDEDGGDGERAALGGGALAALGAFGGADGGGALRLSASSGGLPRASGGSSGVLRHGGFSSGGLSRAVSSANFAPSPVLAGLAPGGPLRAESGGGLGISGGLLARGSLASPARGGGGSAPGTPAGLFASPGPKRVPSRLKLVPDDESGFSLNRL